MPSPINRMAPRHHKSRRVTEIMEIRRSHEHILLAFIEDTSDPPGLLGHSCCVPLPAIAKRSQQLLSVRSSPSQGPRHAPSLPSAVPNVPGQRPGPPAVRTFSTGSRRPAGGRLAAAVLARYDPPSAPFPHHLTSGPASHHPLTQGGQTTPQGSRNRLMHVERHPALHAISIIIVNLCCNPVDAVFISRESEFGWNINRCRQVLPDLFAHRQLPTLSE